LSELLLTLLHLLSLLVQACPASPWLDHTSEPTRHYLSAIKSIVEK